MLNIEQKPFMSGILDVTERAHDRMIWRNAIDMDELTRMENADYDVARMLEDQALHQLRCLVNPHCIACQWRVTAFEISVEADAQVFKTTCKSACKVITFAVKASSPAETFEFLISMPAPYSHAKATMSISCALKEHPEQWFHLLRSGDCEFVIEDSGEAIARFSIYEVNDRSNSSCESDLLAERWLDAASPPNSESQAFIAQWKRDREQVDLQDELDELDELEDLHRIAHTPQLVGTFC